MAAKKTATKKVAKSTGPLTVDFEVDRDTKTTRRFAEVVEEEFAEPVIGTLYVKKSALANLNGGSLPDTLTVTIQAG